MEKRNKKLSLGLGKEVSDKPLWSSQQSFVLFNKGGRPRLVITGYSLRTQLRRIKNSIFT